MVDPKVNLELFAALNKHLSNDDPYKMGILCHLVSDYVYDSYIQNKFNFSNQASGICKLDGKEMDSSQFRPIIYGLYPMLDQYFYNKEEFTVADIENIKTMVNTIFSPKEAEFLSKYITYRDDLTFTESDILSEDTIKTMVKTIHSEFDKNYKKL